MSYNFWFGPAVSILNKMILCVEFNEEVFMKNVSIISLGLLILSSAALADNPKMRMANLPFDQL